MNDKGIVFNQNAKKIAFDDEHYENMMLRYDSFKKEDAKVFNAKIDEIVTFINGHYNEMKEDLFKEMTHKEITDGHKTIIKELKDQLNKGKRF